MRSGSNNFNYFSENKLTKLVNFVLFTRMLMFCLEDWKEGLGPSTPPPWLCHCNGVADLRNYTGTYVPTNDQWAHPGRPLVSSSKTKPCQFISVTSLCVRLYTHTALSSRNFRVKYVYNNFSSLFFCVIFQISLLGAAISS